VRALIENAFLYGDPTAPVRVWVTPGQGRVRVLVSGGGPGPDADEAAHLFERFFRGRSAAEVGHAGSGLGLYTARGIARAHGGDVRRAASSEAPDGFEIEVPLSPD
jgi:two-component system OmpR family sensor kinase